MLNCGVTRCVQYLDDFYSCAPVLTGECQKNKDLMLDVCSQAGVAINPQKLVGPVTKLEFLGKLFLIHCDNMSVVDAVNRGSSRAPDVMSLIQTLFFIACKWNFECKLIHVPGIDNTQADMLSRGLIKTFQERYPSFPKQMSTPAVITDNDILIPRNMNNPVCCRSRCHVMLQRPNRPSTSHLRSEQ